MLNSLSDLIFNINIAISYCLYVQNNGYFNIMKHTATFS